MQDSVGTDRELNRELNLSAQVERMFATRMKERREEQGVSQATLAAALTERYGLKMDSTAITRMEQNATGKPSARVIRLGEAAAIADTLQTSLPDMLRTVPPLWEQVKEAQQEVEVAKTAEAAAIDGRVRAEARLARLKELYQEEMGSAEALQKLEKAHGILREMIDRHGGDSTGEQE